MRYSISRLRWSAPPLGLALLACGGDGPTEPPPIPVAIAMVSGDGQKGKAGEPLSEPFAVRVTDTQGAGVEGVEVTWSVASGRGLVFRPTGDLAIASFRTFAGADGLAAARFIPTGSSASTVVAEAVGLRGSPVTFTAEAASHEWPPVEGSALIYERVFERARLNFSVLRLQRYVLHEDRIFGLQYDGPRFGFSEWAGTYSRGEAEITFSFDATSTAGDMRATGTFDDSGCLIVEYNIVMVLTGFEDGVFCPSEV